MISFVDLHHHLIYGVDDGPKSREEMYAMLRLAAQEQVRDIVCTSHAAPGQEAFPMEAYMQRLREAQAWLVQSGLPVRLHSGCEVMYSTHTMRLLQEGKIPTLAGTGCVLLEFLPQTGIDQIRKAARAIGSLGHTVIFAHVERYRALHRLQHIRELREEYGVYMQMNTGTITGSQGFLQNRRTLQMLDEGLIDCVATDAHNDSTRPCRMLACYEKLRQRYGKDIADELCFDFQRRLLELDDSHQIPEDNNAAQ